MKYTAKDIRGLLRVIHGLDRATGNIIRICAVDQCGSAVDRPRSLLCRRHRAVLIDCLEAAAESKTKVEAAAS